MFSFRLTFFVQCYIYNACLYCHLFVPPVRSSDWPRKRMTDEKVRISELKLCGFILFLFFFLFFARHYTMQMAVGAATRHLDEFKVNCLHRFTEKKLNEHAVAQWNYQVNKTEATEHEAVSLFCVFI